MKAQERHHLKQNEFAATTAKVATALAENRDRYMMIAIAVIVVLAIGGGYMMWKKRTNDQAGALLGQAMAISQAAIVPPPTIPGATQSPGTYPTERARDEAALQAFQQVATAYPSTDAGRAAKYQIAASLLAANRLPEAEGAFRELTTVGNPWTATMARLGLASTLASEAKYDESLKTLTELSADRDGPLPIDGILMELARVSVRAGKTQEARAAFKRVVDEFPQSMYVAEARQQLAQMGS